MKQPNSKTRRRGRHRREDRRIIRVYSEGAVTEFQYLRHWESKNQAVFLDWGESGMTPSSLVEHARRDVKRNRLASRRRYTPEFDEIWCIFDVDEHPMVSQAIFEARQSEIEIAVSNPCFELWLVLHSENCTAYVDRRWIQRRASELNLIDGKSISNAVRAMIQENFDDAKGRAQRLDDMHERNDSPPRSNPSTDVWRLVDRIRP